MNGLQNFEHTLVQFSSLTRTDYLYFVHWHEKKSVLSTFFRRICTWKIFVLSPDTIRFIMYVCESLSPFNTFSSKIPPSPSPHNNIEMKKCFTRILKQKVYPSSGEYDVSLDERWRWLVVCRIHEIRFVAKCVKERNIQIIIFYSFFLLIYGKTTATKSKNLYRTGSRASALHKF